MENRHGTYHIQLGNETLILNQICKQETWQTGRHCNAEYELHILLRGSCQLEVETKQLTLCENQGILIAPGQYHHPKVLETDFTRFSLSFSAPAGQLLTALRKNIPVCRVFSVSPDICHICHNISYEYTAANIHKQEMLQSLLTQLFIQTERLLQLQNSSVSNISSGKEKTLVGQIDNFFEQNFANHAGKAALAKELHMSERQLLRILQKLYGMGFQEKLVYARMDYASWLLRTTKRTITDIAGTVGYSSEGAFFQAFKSHFQMTPQQYRLQFESI